ncbi:sporulation protein YunB [Aneurinibacillus soli]|uniref:Sporulation protein YunB n=1 Tax=Aneurinibacillus soli TaxID=1500254 RepID=A0A0U4WDC4_9BACL|nr:sporulation protein YunB [Aneurinibacillus soli]PYE60903.1 sporulation protein YunB [Aneurinibacillus soli]BAU26808.1 Sporulation protein YunB [Aneurinibacillus soli]
MKRRKNRSVRAPIPSRYMFLISLVIFLGLSIQTFYYIEKNLEPVIRDIARARVEQMATKTLHDAISEKIVKETNFKELVQVQKDKNGKVQVASFDYDRYAHIVASVTENVEHTLEKLEQAPEKIPLGQALRSNLLAQYGPDIPITLVPYGSAHVELKPEVKEAGINMVLVTVYVVVHTKIKIVIPFTTEPASITMEIPISNALIVGDVPQFYYDGNGRAVGSEVPGAVPPAIPPVQMNVENKRN